MSPVHYVKIRYSDDPLKCLPKGEKTIFPVCPDPIGEKTQTGIYTTNFDFTGRTLVIRYFYSCFSIV